MKPNKACDETFYARSQKVEMDCLDRELSRELGR